MSGKKKENQLVVFLTVFLLIFLFLGTVGFINYLKEVLPNKVSDSTNTDVETVPKFESVSVSDNSFTLILGESTLNYSYDSENKEILINDIVLLENISSVIPYKIDTYLVLKTVSTTNVTDVYFITSTGTILNDFSNMIKDYENDLDVSSVTFANTNISVNVSSNVTTCSNITESTLLEQGKCSISDETNEITCEQVNDKILESTLLIAYDKTTDDKFSYTVSTEKTLFYCYQAKYGEITIAQ